MKITIISPEYPPARIEGGISHYTIILAKRLENLGHEIMVIAGDSYTGPAKDGTIIVNKIPGEWRADALKECIKQVTQSAMDVVNVQYSPAMYKTEFKMALPVLLKKFPSTISLHTLWGGGRINYLIALRLTLAAGAIISTNSEVSYLINRFLPFCRKKTSFIPIGANIMPEHGANAESDAITGRCIASLGTASVADISVMVFFGMIYSGKGLDLLLDALHMLKTKQKKDFRFLMIGGGISDVAENLEKHRERARKLGLEENVIWTGHLPEKEVSALISRSTLVVLPYDGGVSDRRGSLMAAVAHGKAVVTTPPRVSIPYFKNGLNMLWPDQVTPDSLCDSIIQVMSDDVFRRRLEQGAKALASFFDWDVIAKDTAVILRQVKDA